MRNLSKLCKDKSTESRRNFDLPVNKAQVPITGKR